MGEQVTLAAAFGAGFLSFISPCVLPLIPGYISFVSGVSLDEMKDGSAPAATRRQVLITSLAFVLGFSVVFVALGASATAIGEFLFDKLPLLGKIAGAIIVILRPAHDGCLPPRVPRAGEAGACRPEARRTAGRLPRRHRVRVRLDAVHRPDSRRGSSPSRPRRTP